MEWRRLACIGALGTIACSSVVDESSIASGSLELSQAAQQCFEPSADATIDSTDPAKSFGGDAECQVDARPQKRCLLRWDLSAIAPGRKVASAFVELHIEDSSRSYYAARPLLSAWSEAGVTWDGAPPQGAAKLFKFRGHRGDHTQFLTAEGVAQVQGWIDAPESNFGVIVPTRDTHRMALVAKEGGAARGTRLCINFR